MTQNLQTDSREPFTQRGYLGRRLFAALITSAFLIRAMVYPSAAPNVSGVTDAAADSAFEVSDRVQVSAVKRVGVNLGRWTSWGAEQLSSNILKNPGFEGLIDRALVIVSRANRFAFTDDQAWLGRADGFWEGARFDVRTGVSAGVSGTIITSRKAGLDGLPEFFTEGACPELASGDVVALTRVSEKDPPAQWWIPRSSAGRVIPDTETCPKSPGVRSVVLNSPFDQPTEIVSYLDAIGDRSGKLLPVNGGWRLSFWSRTSSSDAVLTIKFLRNGSTSFLNRTISPGTTWRKIIFEFDCKDLGPASILELHFAAGANSKVWLDDVELGRADALNFPFRSEVVQALQKLLPAYIRDWQDQLGDTLTNRLAEPFARKSSRYRPGDGMIETDFGYSLPDFLDLCRKVGANPWVVIPTTWSDSEFTGFGQYLGSRAKTDNFEEVIVEFGNENWNRVFRPAGIADPVACGRAASLAFKGIREGAGQSIKLITNVNGQFANPEYAARFVTNSTADSLAVAPYFGYSFERRDVPEALLTKLFADDGELSKIYERVGSKEIAVAEVNLHSTEGDLPGAERDTLVAGEAAGSALAKRILQSIAKGARRQCVYELAGYDAKLSDQEGLVKLWGIVRDLGPTNRFRPTGLSVQLLNQAIGGDMVEVVAPRIGYEGIYVWAFKTSEEYSAIVVSTLSHPSTITVRFPTRSLPNLLLRLDSPGISSTNETSEQVRAIPDKFTVQDSTFQFDMPAYGLAIAVTDPARK